MDKILNDFTFTRVLNEDPAFKTVCILGSKPDPITGEYKSAILMIEKLHFVPQELEHINVRSGRLESLQCIDSNDIYFWFKSQLSNNFNVLGELTKIPDIKMQLIFPATEIHISKYSYQPRYMIEESYDLFRSVISPTIDSFPASQIGWVYNLLEGKSEQSSILYKDVDPNSGFVLLPDSKWDKTTMSSLYLLVIVNRRDIRCLRDLQKEHLHLLKNIQKVVPMKVEELYPGLVSKNQVRLFVHYLPTYYHFHVHVVHVQNVNAPGMVVGQAHLLSTIIDNIENIDENYYQKASLNYSLGENHPIYKAINRAS